MLGPMALLRPSELARIWALHPKTVYLWIREGRLPAVKTPGAQYRVRTDDARAYCERHDLPMPRALANPCGTVIAVGKPSPAQRALAKACKSRGTTFAAWATPLEGLLAVAGDPPDVVAIDARCARPTAAEAVRALRNLPRTTQLPVVIYDAAARATSLAKIGASRIVTRGDELAAAKAVIELLDDPAAAQRPDPG